jgi:hypothetical protein
MLITRRSCIYLPSPAERPIDLVDVEFILTTRLGKHSTFNTQFVYLNAAIDSEVIGSALPALS